MSIYKQVMGNEFFKLHPKLQQRYESTSFRPTGVMYKIPGAPKLLGPILRLGVNRKLLCPEHGTNMHFTITNTPRIGAHGERHIHWERIFYFKEKDRFCNALMRLDLERNILKDRL